MKKFWELTRARHNFIGLELPLKDILCYLGKGTFPCRMLCHKAFLTYLKESCLLFIASEGEAGQIPSRHLLAKINFAMTIWVKAESYLLSYNYKVTRGRPTLVLEQRDPKRKRRSLSYIVIWPCPIWLQRQMWGLLPTTRPLKTTWH